MKIERILVSQPQGVEAKKYYDTIAEKHGVTIDFKQFIHIESLTPKEFRAQKISIFPDHTSVIFTSRHSIDHFFNLCKEMRVNVPATTKFFCLTEEMSLYIQNHIQYRKRRNFFATDGKFESLLPQLQRHSKEVYFVPRSSVHTDDIARQLTAAGLRFDEAVMYRTVSTLFEEGDIDNYDMMVFFSPAGIKSLLENKPGFEQGEMIIGAFGKQAAQAVAEQGLRLDLEAPNPAATSMPAALDKFLTDNKTKSRSKK